MSAAGWIAVAVLGGAGALVRFFVDRAVGSRAATDFPLGTLVVNVSGALLLGLVAGLAFEGERLVLAGAAALGSYTTFSTWMLETQRLTEDGEHAYALANVFVSLAAGLLAVAAGRVLGGLL